jgi:hypothetical protein
LKAFLQSISSMIVASSLAIIVIGATAGGLAIGSPIPVPPDCGPAQVNVNTGDGMCLNPTNCTIAGLSCITTTVSGGTGGTTVSCNCS